MKDNQLKEKASYFSEKYKYKNHIKAVILAFGLVVFLGTAYGLSGQGHAKTHTVKELNCSCQVHQHSDDCYDEDGNLICGQADYVVHEHNDDCYDAAGNLVCTLPEIKAHEHTDSCYEEKKVLVCGLEESEGHVHTDDCYALTGGELICGLEEHTHTDECYDEEGNLICTLEEHTHTDDCYAPMEETLVCGMEEGEGAHTHTDACYETQKVLVCGENELHTHTEDCYDEEGNLICGKLELKEHVHGDECFTEREMTADEIRQMEEALEEKEEGNEGSAESETAETKDDSQAAEDTDTETFSQTAETENYVITATYTVAAEIPEDALFQAKEITEESDPETYEKRLSQLKEEYGENYQLTVLINSGFYVDGEEYEPKATVDIEVEAKSGETLDNVNRVSHFKNNGDEIEEIAPETDEDGAVDYSQNSFSDAALGSVATNDGGTITTTSTNTSSPVAITLTKGRSCTVTGAAGQNSSSWGTTYTSTYSWTVYSDSSYSTVDIYDIISVSPNNTQTITVSANTVGTVYLRQDITTVRTYYELWTQKTSTDHTYSYYIVTVIPGAGASAISITDRIISDGTLQATIDSNISYSSVVWYKATVSATATSVTAPADDAYTEVARERKSGTAYNMEESGAWLNPSLDGGARTASTATYYKIALKDEDGNLVTDEDGNVIYSEPFLVRYYDSLQNGSFEHPVPGTDGGHVLGGGWNVFSNAEYVNAGGVWQSTGTGTAGGYTANIEIVSSGVNNAYDWYNKDTRTKRTEAADGNYLAELNAQSAGALYQDVMTIPGTTLNWWLNHRARGMNANSTPEYDTMYLLVMSTELAKKYNVTSDSVVSEIVSALKAGSTDYPGAYVQEIKSDDQSWHYYSGTYDIPDGQYLTRFFFVAGTTASNDPTIGNFLDYVGFSYDLPPAQDGTAYLQLEKHLPAMPNDEAHVIINKLQFNVDGKIINASAFHWTGSESAGWTGTYSFIYNDVDTKQQTVNVNEVADTVEYDKGSGTEKNYKFSGYTIALDGSQTYSSSIADGHVQGVALVAKTTKVISFTNNYQPDYSDFTFLKYGETASGDYEALEDAKFGLYTKQDNEDDPYKLVASATSTDDGTVSFTALDHSVDYYIHEDESPDDYKQDTAYHLLRYDRTANAWKLYTDAAGTSEVSDKANNLYVIKNNKKETTIEFVKKAADGGKKTLAGAVFTLKKVNGSEKSDISSDKLQTSGDDGIFSKTGMKLEEGSYVLTETTAPDGYNLLTHDVSFKIESGIAELTNTTTSAGSDAEVEEIKNADNKVTGYRIIVYDSTGAELPATGGSGTFAFTLTGLMLFAAAAILGASRLKGIYKK